MRIREWKDIVEDVVERDTDPDDWRAVGGTRSGGVGEDLYLGHPSAGVYLLKTYAKNPYEVKGVGARVARSLDDEIGSFLPEKDSGGRFAVQNPPEDEGDAEQKAKHLEEVVKAHADAPTTPNDFFDDVMDALDSPAFGPIDYDQYGRPAPADELSEQFEEAEDLLNSELDDLIDEDSVGRGFQ
ncbi:hypothetical protein [Halorussus amylolyticus]|uniref:hypothetical protein n=1 Tax=Halorussus amylolyticus TaxID=1126242 RepID=UPI0010521A76|nr:hypothetical protein [Halorussus amylolyticus]